MTNYDPVRAMEAARIMRACLGLHGSHPRILHGTTEGRWHPADPPARPVAYGWCPDTATEILMHDDRVRRDVLDRDATIKEWIPGKAIDMLVDAGGVSEPSYIVRTGDFIVFPRPGNQAHIGMFIGAGRVSDIVREIGAPPAVAAFWSTAAPDAQNAMATNDYLSQAMLTYMAAALYRLPSAYSVSRADLDAVPFVTFDGNGPRAIAAYNNRREKVYRVISRTALMAPARRIDGPQRPPEPRPSERPSVAVTDGPSVESFDSDLPWPNISRRRRFSRCC